jgi:hypothetical protein
LPEWSDVVELAARLPETEESTWFGTPSLKVRGKGLCRLRSDPDALVVRVVDVADQQALVLGDPDVFFVTSHYENWPYVLVRLDAVAPDQLWELIEDAWRVQAPRRLVKAYEEGRDPA